MFRKILAFILLATSANTALAQYPSYFSYTIENGSPSNEVYGILQDKQGYIWTGSNAGLYRYNGVKFEHFSSPDLTSRAVSGVCQASTGTIYAYNFNGQLLSVSNGKLTVLKGWNQSINNIATDQNGLVWISTGEGLYCLSDKTKKWKKIQDIDAQGKPQNAYTSCVRTQNNGAITYMNNGNIVVLKNNSKQIHPINIEMPSVPVFITDSRNDPWAFRMVDGLFFRLINNRFELVKNQQLTNLLKSRKITNAQEIGDDIWLSTHSGIVRFNKQNKSATLYYPQIAFSSCLRDNEGNYWFTTLYDGVLRMPNLEYMCWNIQTGASATNQFSHVINGNGTIYFASTVGVVGEMQKTNSRFYATENSLKSDIGAMYYDSVEKCIFYNKMNSVYRYCDGKSSIVNEFTRPIKDFFRLNNDYLLATSQGTYVYSLPNAGFKEQYKMLDDWSREIIKSPFDDHFFIIGNHGLHEFLVRNNGYKRIRTYFKDKQITGVCSDNERLYLLTFTGEVYVLNKDKSIVKVLQLEGECRATQIKYHNNQLFFATNLGVGVYHITTKKKWFINSFHGLSSNNIKSIVFVDKYCWIATGKGLHRLPEKSLRISKLKGKIVLRNLIVNGQPADFKQLKQLNYSDNLRLSVDGLSYRSNGNFSFAYRFVGDKTGWIKVPASADDLSIPRLPLGEVELEVKLIDHEQFDSVNTIRFSLYIQAPFWQRWWFYLLLTLSVLSLSYLFFKKRIAKLRERQEQRLKQMRLENELRLTQQNALKAQMNPHFLFNVLNSIKGFIYENDKKNAAKYLGDFSSLVRKVLDMSSLSTVSLADELETLKLYINLESMLLQDRFEFELMIDSRCDKEAIHLPSLLLQPYVENAFKHGLRHKKGDKRLTISVSENIENNTLEIKIFDNGIGRKAAEEINKSQSSNHVSFATNANQKRIELLNFEKAGIVGVTYEDLTSENGDSNGTIVIIHIHLS